MTNDNQDNLSEPVKESPEEPKSTRQEEPLSNKEEMSEFFKTAIVAVLIALFIRTFFFEPFNIPSGSMLPTLKVGDYLFVSKLSYGYSKYSFPFGLADFDGRYFAKEPERGDVVVFKLPTNPGIDYIKRIVAMPGERVQVKSGRLYINDELVKREPVGLKKVDLPYGGQQAMMEYIETLPDGTMHLIYEESDNDDLDNTRVFEVPEDHYFLMGDNRDNSQDSRVQSLVGFVPYEKLVGRAEILFFSIDPDTSLFKPWQWPFDIRYNRIFDLIGPVRPEEEQPAS